MVTRRATPTLLLSLAVAAGAAAQADSLRRHDRFAAGSEARLDSLYGPLLYLMQADERGIYPALSLSRKRAYLRHFWARRDPTPGTPENELADDFYARIAAANRKFPEGRLPGWRTDRGRIYVKHGPPDQVLLRPHPPGTLPYEVWKYTGRRQAKYCFADITRFGSFVLVWTNDPQERSEPNWRQLLDSEAYQEVMRF